MGAALTVLAGRLRDPRPAGEASWLPDSGNTGPVRLPIAFTADSAWPGFTEMNNSDAEGYSGCSCHLCRFLACCLTRRRHLGM